MDVLWATKSKRVRLIARAISFQDFQPILIHERHGRTVGQTNGRTTSDHNTALCTIVCRAVKMDGKARVVEFHNDCITTGYIATIFMVNKVLCVCVCYIAYLSCILFSRAFVTFG